MAQYILVRTISNLIEAYFYYDSGLQDLIDFFRPKIHYDGPT